MFIQVKNLSKKFNDTTAVNNINLNIEKNKTLGLLGPNGCGKTTTIGMLLGLIKPSEGEIIIDGKNLNEYSRDEILVRLTLHLLILNYQKNSLFNKIWRFMVGFMELKI